MCRKSENFETRMKRQEEFKSVYSACKGGCTSAGFVMLELT